MTTEATPESIDAGKTPAEPPPASDASPDAVTGKSPEPPPPSPRLPEHLRAIVESATKDPAKAALFRQVVENQRRRLRDDPAGVAIEMPWIKDRVEAWEAAKRSGDGAATGKAYAHLLRGLRVEQLRRGIPEDEHKPVPNAVAEDTLREMFGKPPAEWLAHLRDAVTSHAEFGPAFTRQIAPLVPPALRAAFDNPSKLIGELMWRRTVESGKPEDLLPDLPELRSAGLYQQPAMRPSALEAVATDVQDSHAGDRMSFGDPQKGGSAPPRETPAESPPDPDIVLPEFENTPRATELGPPIQIWDSQKTGGSFANELEAVRAAFQRLSKRCRGGCECGGNIYKVGNRYYYDLYQGYSRDAHNFQVRSDAVAWFHNHPTYGGQEKDLSFSSKLTKPVLNDPEILRMFKNKFNRPLGAYILVGNRIHYYKDYLTDTRDEVFSN